MDHCTYPGASANGMTENGGVHAGANGFARVDGAGRTYPRAPNPSLRRKCEPPNSHGRKDQSSVVVEIVVVEAGEAPQLSD